MPTRTDKDAEAQGDRAERLGVIFDEIVVDPDIPRCSKCQSRVLAGERLCMSCKGFAAKDRERYRSRK